MKIELKKVDALSSDPKNARSHSEANLIAIEYSLKTFGQRKPIVIDKAGVVIAGNGTLEAAKRLRWQEIATVQVPDDWNDEMISAFAIADNRTAELAEWDREVLATALEAIDLPDFEAILFDYKEEIPDFTPVDEAQPALDERVKHDCPHCGKQFEMKNGKPSKIV